MKNVALILLFSACLLSASVTALAVTATGGNMTNVGNYTVHTFTNSGTFSVSASGTVEVLVVGGGGGGGNNAAGGGGAGGLIYSNSVVVTNNQSITVTVGGGGAAAVNSSSVASSGANSVFGSLTAIGGGGGSSRDGGPQASSGGSGGGGGGATASPRHLAGSGTAGQGNAGGNGTTPNAGVNAAGGGGGGAGGGGTVGTSQNGGNGGIGLQYASFAAVGGSPTGWFAGGGAGSSYGTQGLGGTNGGGGNVYVAGVANTGGGGGAYAAGGSGIVIVRYFMQSLPVINNQVASNVMPGSASLNGYLVSTGQAPTSVFVYWGTNDGGAVAGNWANTNTFSPVPQGAGPLATNITGLVPNTVYYYRYYANNNWGGVWADPPGTFITGDIMVQATTPNASEFGPVNGVFTFYRPAWSTNGSLTVGYSLAGTASNGVDYVTLTGQATFPVGATNTTVTVMPIADGIAEGPETVLLTLTGGGTLGTPSNATVTIADAGVVNQFTAAIDGYWDEPGNWSLTHVPISGESVEIDANVVLTNSTAALNGYILNAGKTHTFVGSNTVLHAVGVTIRGVMTHPVNTDTNGADGWQADNRVWIDATNVTIEATGGINVNVKGYQGALTPGGAGFGPGHGTGSDSGSSHGGFGMGRNVGGTYDSPYAPVEPGSGGGWNDSPGGTGGGVVRIAASGNVCVNGTISADGQNVGNSGAGAGGSIYITCRTYSGTTGSIHANGGWLLGFVSVYGAPSGGGRIAIVYDTAAQQAMEPATVSAITCDGGVHQPTGTRAGIGTIYLPDGQLLPTTLTSAFNGIYYGITNWAPSSLTVNNALITFVESRLRLTVANDALVTGAGQLDLALTDFICGGNLTVTNSSALTVRSAPAYSVATNFGTLVTVAGDVAVASNCWIYPYSVGTNGASVQWEVRNLNVLAGGFINADGKGWAAGNGPGRGANNIGAGYGGLGGGASAPYGQMYGDSNAPVDPGSGGNNSSSGAGGGAIRVEASGAITVSGTISANGQTGYEPYSGVGGSGGGIYLIADTFAPSYGVMSANGGGITLAGGGGGRIALLSRIDNFGGTLTVAGAGNPMGGTGTVVRLLQGGLVSLSIEGNPERHGTPAPLNYGANGVMQGDGVTNSVNSPADQASGIRYVCLGWNLKTDLGDPVDSGITTQAIFQVNTNLVLNWVWTNQFYLTASANVNGVLQTPVTGWYTNGTPVTLTAVANGGFDFLMWSGTGVPAGSSTNNPLTVNVNQARTIQANFSSQTPGARVWSGTGNWFDSTKWSPAGVPGRQDAITIGSGTANVIDATTLNAASLTINGQLHVESGVVFNVAASTLISGGSAQLRLSNDVFLCGGDLVLTNGAVMDVYSGPTNPALAAYGGSMLTNYGALVSVGNNFILATNCWVYPYSPLFQKGAPYFIARNLSIAAGAGFNADAKGYQSGGDTNHVIYGATAFGPGRGGNYGGGGYGGLGGGAAYPYGQTYGDSNAPVEQGSGGAGGWSGEFGGNGGGAIQIKVTATTVIDGLLSANGGNGNYGGYTAAGGSGGGIYLQCNELRGIGLVQANGGDGCSYNNYAGKPGGGGRIALWTAGVGADVGTVTVLANPGHISGPITAGAGTIVWVLKENGSVYLVR